MKFQNIPTNISPDFNNTEYLIKPKNSTLYILSNHSQENITVTCPDKIDIFSLDNIPELICKEKEKEYVEVSFESENQLDEGILCIFLIQDDQDKQICNSEQSNKVQLNITKQTPFEAQLVIKQKYLDEEIPYLLQFQDQYKPIQLKQVKATVDGISVYSIDTIYLPINLIHVIYYLNFNQTLQTNDYRCSYVNYYSNFNDLKCNQSYDAVLLQPQTQQQNIVLGISPLYQSGEKLYANKSYLFQSENPILVYSNVGQYSFQAFVIDCGLYNNEQSIDIPYIQADSCGYLFHTFSQQFLECIQLENSLEDVQYDTQIYCIINFGYK